VCVPFCLVGACVCLFDLLARVCAYLVVGTGGVPFWHGGKGACVCLFDLLEQLVGLFGMEASARVCAFWACWRACLPFWVVGTDGGPLWY